MTSDAVSRVGERNREYRGTGFGANSLHHQCVAGCKIRLGGGDILRTSQFGLDVTNSPLCISIQVHMRPLGRGPLLAEEPRHCKEDAYLDDSTAVRIYGVHASEDLEVMVDTLGVMRRNNSRDIEDEAVVNVTLIQLLDCIESLMEPAGPGWTIKREIFCPKFRKAEYPAVTDGALRTRIKRHVLGIIEGKKGGRLASIDKIRMQETVAVFGGHRLLLAQNGADVYLVFGEAERGYLDVGGPESGHLVMHTFVAKRAAESIDR
ncbi:uncharacterized protein BJX67DRAFT_386010 [Aspergillus lucknowensis]|uniref:Uncharacterized protein n=1 Tax=Aspergillus lucknowensis TaxID=176173 RepID=A0ABR4L9M5_9EURO